MPHKQQGVLHSARQSSRPAGWAGVNFGSNARAVSVVSIRQPRAPPLLLPAHLLRAVQRTGVCACCRCRGSAAAVAGVAGLVAFLRLFLSHATAARCSLNVRISNALDLLAQHCKLAAHQLRKEQERAVGGGGLGGREWIEWVCGKP